MKANNTKQNRLIHKINILLTQPIFQVQYARKICHDLAEIILIKRGSSN